MRKDEVQWLFGYLLEPTGLSSEPLRVSLYRLNKFCIYYNDVFLGWYVPVARRFETQTGDVYYADEHGFEELSRALHNLIIQTAQNQA